MTDTLLTAKRSDDSHDQYYMLVLLTGNRMDGGRGMMKDDVIALDAKAK